MPDRAFAATLLAPLAPATLGAFRRAREDLKAFRRTMAEERAELDRARLGLSDGVFFWLCGSSHLQRAFANVPSIFRNEFGPLRHVWTVAGVFQLRLKSDIYSVEADQLVLPGVSDPRGGVVFLSASAASSSAFFVGRNNGRVQWSLPVAALVDRGETPIVAPHHPRAVVRSRRIEVQDARLP